MEFAYVIKKEEVAEELVKAKNNADKNDQGYLMFWLKGLKPKIDEYGAYVAIECNDGSGVYFSSEDFDIELIEDIIEHNPSLITPSLVRKVIDLFLAKEDKVKSKD